jgi:hypothetical protein
MGHIACFTEMIFFTKTKEICVSGKTGSVLRAADVVAIIKTFTVRTRPGLFTFTEITPQIVFWKTFAMSITGRQPALFVIFDCCVFGMGYVHG